MKERIKMIRINAQATQEEFASKIGISKSSVSLLESGRNNPSEQTIRAICDQYHISRIWLESGVGDMMKPVTREEELASLMGKLLNCEPSFKHRLIAVLLRMDPSEWEMLERKAQELFEEMKKADPEGSAGDC